jgi:hypothetical protein
VFHYQHEDNKKMSSVMLSTKVDEDSELAEEFEEFKESNSMYSKSEAIRTLMRAGLEQKQQETANESASEESTSDGGTAPVLSTENLAYVSVAFYLGFQILPSWLTSVEGVSLAIGVTGALILIAVPIAVSKQLIREVGSKSERFGGFLDGQRTQEAD